MAQRVYVLEHSLSTHLLTCRNLPSMMSYPPCLSWPVLPAIAATTLIFFGSFTQFSSFPLSPGFTALNGAQRVVFRTRIFDFVHPRMDVHICSVLRKF